MPLLAPVYHIIPGTTSIIEDFVVIGGAVILVVLFTYAWNRWGRF